MPRRRVVIVAVLAGVAALALLAWLNWPRDEPKRATVDDAVRSFRAQGEGLRAGAGAGEPALGVYRYATAGGEEAEAILDASHDYDGVSTITLSAGRCGQRERWQVLEGRWTEAESCPVARGSRLAAATEFHEFFGVEREDAFSCRGPSTADPPDPSPGARFVSTCRSDDSSIATSARMVGLGRVEVDGKAYQAIHSVSHSRLEGETNGTSTRQDWRRRSDGLLLRRVVVSEAETSVAGGTHYRERYLLQLLEVKPER